MVMAKIIEPMGFGPVIGGPAYFTFQVPAKSAGAAARLVAVRRVVAKIDFMAPPYCNSVPDGACGHPRYSDGLTRQFVNSLLLGMVLSMSFVLNRSEERRAGKEGAFR